VTSDGYRINESAQASVLCARCKQPVKAGEQHQCSQEEKQQNEKTKQEIAWSKTGTPFSL